MLLTRFAIALGNSGSVPTVKKGSVFYGKELVCFVLSPMILERENNF